MGGRRKGSAERWTCHDRMVLKKLVATPRSNRFVNHAHIDAPCAASYSSSASFPSCCSSCRALRELFHARVLLRNNRFRGSRRISDSPASCGFWRVSCVAPTGCRDGRAYFDIDQAGKRPRMRIVPRSAVTAIRTVGGGDSIALRPAELLQVGAVGFFRGRDPTDASASLTASAVERLMFISPADSRTPSTKPLSQAIASSAISPGQSCFLGVRFPSR